MHTGTFTFTDNTEVFLRAWHPASVNGTILTTAGDAATRPPEPSHNAETIKGAVLCLHGVESHSEWFEEMAAHLIEKNYIVFAFDRTGWGQSSGTRGHLPSYNIAVRQVSELATSLRRSYGSCHLAGLSWGGLLAMYSALRRGILFDSVSLIAPGICSNTDLPMLDKFRTAAGVLLKRPKTVIALPIQVKEFTKRAGRTEYIQHDPHRITAVTASFCVETMKMRKFVTEMAAKRRLPPTQLLLAEDDSIIDNAATRTLLGNASCHRFALGEQPQTSIAMKEYDGCIHSLVFEAPERVAEDIARLAESTRAVKPCPPIRPKENATVSEEPASDTADKKTKRLLYSFNCAIPEETSDATPTPSPGNVPPPPPHVAIMGAGAIGSLVGGLLAWGGVPVTLIGREAHVNAIREHGLHLRIGHGQRFIRDNLAAVTSPAELATPPDLVILAVKGFDTAKALEQLRPAVSDAAAFLSLQNGLHNEEAIHAAFPNNAILAGEICANTEFSAPGEIQWFDDRGGLAGALYHGDESVAEELWHRVFPASGMEAPFCTGTGAAKRIKWSKLLLNVMFNALNAVTGWPMGQILRHPEYGPLAARALKEGFAVMMASEIAPLDLPGYPLTQLAKLCRLPVGIVRRILLWTTGEEKSAASSMRQDLLRKKHATEIDAINGALVQAGQKYNIPTPANERLCQLVHEKTES